MHTVNVLQHLLPDYELIAQIGTGLGGETWLASGPSGQVAIKVLSQRKVRAAPAFAQMLGEAMVLTTLKHPHVVPYLAFVHDSARGVAALVMKYIEGGDLEVYVSKNGPFDCRNVCRLGQTLVSAVEALHSAGYLHRDLKPRNILIQPSETGAPVLFLADFGISQPLVDGVAQARNRALTPGYAAPEQWVTVHLGESVDIFALGAVLWYMFTGLHPGEDEQLYGPEALLANELSPGLAARVQDPVALDLVRLLADMMVEVPTERITLARVGARLAELGRAPRSLETWETSIYAPPERGPVGPHPGVGTLSLELDALSDAEADDPGVPDLPHTHSAETLALFDASTVVARSPLLPAEASPPASPPVAERRPVPGVLNAPWLRSGLALGFSVGIGALGALAVLWVLSGRHDPLPPPPAPVDAAPLTAEPPELMVVPEGAFRWQSDDAESPRRPISTARATGSSSEPEARPAPTTAEPAPEAARPPEPGTLSVNVNRGWADVYLDGEKIETTPLYGYTVSAGPHTIRIVNPNTGAELSRKITVRSGKDEHVSYQLP